MKKNHRFKLLFVFFLFPIYMLGGCVKKDGSACAACSSDSDCKDGLVCEVFGNSQIATDRCGDPNIYNQTCN